LVRWSSTFLALVLTTVLWHGGRVLEKNVSVCKRSAQLSALKPTTEGATGLGFGGAGQ
jgi:hypothetical protein